LIKGVLSVGGFFMPESPHFMRLPGSLSAHIPALYEAFFRPAVSGEAAMANCSPK
jgi:hypothetical protein